MGSNVAYPGLHQFQQFIAAATPSNGHARELGPAGHQASYLQSFRRVREVDDQNILLFA